MATLSADEPSEQAFNEAVEYLLKHFQRTVVLTMVLKLHVKSKAKRAALLWAIHTVTTMTSRVLNHLREDPGVARTDGAIACILQLVAEQQETGKTGYPIRHLAEIIRKRHGKHQDVQSLGAQISGPLRDGVYRSCALMVLRWFAQTIVPLFTRPSNGSKGDSESEEIGPNAADSISLSALLCLPIPDIYRRWSGEHQRYQAAARVLMPFGRQRGRPLGELGERELLWLQSRMLPLSRVQSLLNAVEALLYPDPDDPAAARQAARVTHPWKVRPKAERAVRGSRLDQKQPEPARQPLFLGELAEQELEKFHDELLDMQTFARQYAKISDAVELLLATEFHRFPSVAPFADTHQALELEQRHTRALRRFHSPFPAKSKSPDQYTTADLDRLERATRDEILRAESALLDPKTQSLHLVRKMHPVEDGIDHRGYALLYEPETMRYRMVIDLYGRAAPQPLQETMVTRDAPHHFLFVTHPQQQYVPLKQSPRLSFGIECGYTYQEMRFLRPAIGHSDFAVGKRPELGDARIVMAEDQIGKYEFFAHIPVKIPVNPPRQKPNAILAFHHRTGYSYALTSLDGCQLEVGDVEIPAHVSRKKSMPYSHNYPYEVVHAMLRLADDYLQQGYIPLIAIENTDWKKKPSLSRGRNQHLFSQPIAKIVEVLCDKALLKGYLKPLIVGGVAPDRQCGVCAYRYPKGESGIDKRTPIVCPECQSKKLEFIEEQQQWWCLTCEQPCKKQELVFTCDACGTSMPARHNTSLAVARQARSTAVRIYEYAQG